jgi:hypothetical protein
MDTNDRKPKITRRRALKIGALTALSAPTLAAMERFAPYQREALAQSGTPSDIQFDIDRFIAPVQTINGIPFQFGPIYTYFVTARLNRTPNRTDRTNLISALNTIQQQYPWNASNAFVFLAYGRPYFNRLPGGLNGNLVSSRMPRLRSNTSRIALEEAVPSPVDVPNITKRTPLFNVPVRIETNDMVFTIRSDNQQICTDIVGWLSGSGRLGGRNVTLPGNLNQLWTFTSTRVMFARRSLPREIADTHRLQFANRVNPESPMWMGFADQQVNASGPAQICTFVGNNSARLTNATTGSYFDNGAIQHLSHVIMDLNAFYAIEGEDGFLGENETFLERVQYMFHSEPNQNRGFTDQFSNGGGPAFLPNKFLGTGQARLSASGVGTDVDDETGEPERRFGHVSALHRSSRAADGTPIHIRMDGPGFDRMDVPNGTEQPKLQFTVFVPTADFFTNMRRNQASLDIQEEFDVEEVENGIERFLTATRRQNFLIPPRRNRAFPLVELT